MKKLFLLLIPITLLTLCGCSDRWYYATSEELSKEISLVYSAIDRNEALMNEKINDLLQTWIVEETTRAEICVWLTDITVSKHQAKDLFECIGNWQWYCNCIEKYASCWAKLSDIPKEYQNDFNPECLYNE